MPGRTPLGDAAELAALAVGGTARMVEEVHQAIARRAFGPAGGGTAHAAYERVTGGVYSTVGGLSRLIGAVAAVGVSSWTGPPSPLADRLRGLLNAAVGDRLEADGRPTRLAMTVRHVRKDVEPTALGLAAAYPDATPRLAVFVHGLADTEAAWGDGPDAYPVRLAAELGFTSVLVRYNTGLHISDNGRRFAGLLDELVTAWPVTVDEVVVVGSSMGGLVARAACHVAAGQTDARPPLRGPLGPSLWPELVTHVICLGAPHFGSHVEQAAHLASWALAIAAESRPFSAVVDRRSDGIKDLRYGYIRDEDWQGFAPDDLLRNRRGRPSALPRARIHVLAATATRQPGHPVGRLTGDLVVRTGSATAGTEFAEEDRTVVGGVHHFRLANHPAVYQVIRGWLAPTAGAPAEVVDQR